MFCHVWIKLDVDVAGIMELEMGGGGAGARPRFLSSPRVKNVGRHPPQINNHNNKSPPDPNDVVATSDQDLHAEGSCMTSTHSLSGLVVFNSLIYDALCRVPAGPQSADRGLFAANQ